MTDKIEITEMSYTNPDPKKKDMGDRGVHVARALAVWEVVP